MNSDSHPSGSPTPSPLPPELELRVIAWVMGDAPPAEIAELEKFAAANPALAKFREQAQATLGLAAEASRPDREPLRLSPERREKLLKTLAGEKSAAPVAPLEQRLAQAAPVRPRPVWRRPAFYYSISGLAAACLALMVWVDTRETPQYKAAATMQLEKADTIVTSTSVVSQRVSSDASYSDTRLPPLVRSPGPSDPHVNYAIAQDIRQRQREEQKLLSASAPVPASPEEESSALLKSIRGQIGGAPAVAKNEAGTANAPVFADSLADQEAQGKGLAFSTPLASIAPPPQAPAPATVDKKALLDSFKPQTFSGSTIGGSVSLAAGTAEGSSGASLAPANDDVVKLEPFEVRGEPTGYAAANTMSGTRFSSKTDFLAGNLPPPLPPLPLDGAALRDAMPSPAKSAAAPNGGARGSEAVTLSANGGLIATGAGGLVASGGIGAGGAAAPTSPASPNMGGMIASTLYDTNDFNFTQLGKLTPSGAPAGATTPEVTFGTGNTFGVTGNATGTSTNGNDKTVVVWGAASAANPFEVAPGTPITSRLKTTLTDGGASISIVTKPSLVAAKDIAPPASPDVVMMEAFVPTGSSIKTAAKENAPAAPTLNRGDTAARRPAAAVAAPASGMASAGEPAFDRTPPVTAARSVQVAARSKVAAAPAAPAVDTDAPLPRSATPAPAADEAFRAEVAAQAQPVSTFSLHVSDVSFRLAAAALAKGQLPDVSTLRPEEFYNAFDYGDTGPGAGDKITCHIEQAAHPFLQERNLVRVAMKVAAAGRSAGRPLRLTVLLDTSGSMEREDRVTIIHAALAELVSLLGPEDRVTLIGFARQPRLLADDLPGNQARTLVDLATHTPPDGGTNLEAALQLAGEIARKHLVAGAQNRIVLLTDGAANLGNADPAALATRVETLRQQGIAFDACGIGLNGLDDGVLENLTRKGDGRYTVLNTPAEAGAGFARQLAGAFRPAAENVKVQVRFNPARVGAYRLIGFEQHRLRAEDFRNDQVDGAAELAADEAAVALYQVEARPQGEGELGEVFVRFRDPDTGQMVERSWTLPYDPAAPAFDRATPSLQLAGTAALLAERLRGGAPAAAIRLDDLAPVVNALRTAYPAETRVQELGTMFNQARRLVH